MPWRYDGARYPLTFVLRLARSEQARASAPRCRVCSGVPRQRRMSRRTSCCTPSWPLLDHRVWAVHPRLTVPAPGALLGRPRSPDLAALSAGRGIGAARRSKACLLHVKEKPHISRRGAFSTGGGALRWPSGSTLVRIDGPPSFRAVHSPLLTGGPADSDSTGSPNRSQHRRVGAAGRTRPTLGTEPDGVLLDLGSKKEEYKTWLRAS